MMDWICPAIIDPRSSHIRRSSQTCPKTPVVTKFRVSKLSQVQAVHFFLSVVSAVLVSQGQRLMYAVMIHRLCYMPSAHCGYTGYNVVMRCTHTRTHYQMQSVMVRACSDNSFISVSPSQCSMFFVLVCWQGNITYILARFFKVGVEPQTRLDC